MTKKHYEAIARIILFTPEREAAQGVAKKLCIYFVADNPKFKKDKFLRACGF